MGDDLKTAIPSIEGGLSNSLHIKVPSILQKHWSLSSGSAQESTFVFPSQKQPSIEYAVGVVHILVLDVLVAMLLALVLILILVLMNGQRDD